MHIVPLSGVCLSERHLLHSIVPSTTLGIVGMVVLQTIALASRLKDRSAVQMVVLAARSPSTH